MPRFARGGRRRRRRRPAIIVVIGYYIRTHVSEASIFLEARAQVEAEKAIS